MESKVVFGGGCFWCTEAIFRELKGVTAVKSGYSGGHIKNPAYREVCSGRTGHAEVIEITYNPEQISFEDLIIIHMTTHDPTTLNRQGADSGTQYRSVIFYKNDKEKVMAEEIIRELKVVYDDAIVTELAQFEQFFEAESDHQDYYNRNKEAMYCTAVISPKLSKFKKLHKKYIDTALVSN